MSGHLGVLGLWYRWGRGIRLASSDAISVDFGGMSAVSPTDLERREEIEPGPSLCCQSGLTQSIDNAQGRFLCPCSHFWEVSRPGVLCPLRMPPTAVFQKKKKSLFLGSSFFLHGQPPGIQRNLLVVPSSPFIPSDTWKTFFLFPPYEASTTFQIFHRRFWRFLQSWARSWATENLFPLLGGWRELLNIYRPSF